MVEILLATYNGEKHVAAQIDSILKQTFSTWTLLIHDDGSTDGTTVIVREYEARYPDRIFLLDDGVVAGGAKENFNHLLCHSRGEYIMLCDQDDVWLPNKVDLTFRAMIDAEGQLGNSVPIAVFTDLKIVNSELAPIAESGWRFQRNGPQFCNEFRLLAVRNCITGCTLMVNRPAVAISIPVPYEAVMHDWWIGLCVLKNGGSLVPLSAQTVLYRQHKGNVIGATQYDLNYFIGRAFGLLQTIRDQIAVYRMAKRIGAARNWVDFLRCKGSVLLATITEKCAHP